MDEAIKIIAEKCFNSQQLDTAELPLLHPYIEGFLDGGWLDTRLKEYQAWALDNSDPFLQHNFLHRPIGFNMLVAAIWAVNYWENEYKNDASFMPRMGATRLINIACSLAVLEFHAGQWLNVSAREHLQQRLQTATELWGVIHELNTFAFFIRRGAKVEPYFLNMASTQEIIVNWHGGNISVECKNLRPGTGRSISQDTFITLAGYIASDMVKLRKTLLIKIGTTGTLPDEDIDFLRLEVKKNAGNTIGPVLVENNGRTYSIMGQQLPDKVTEHEARESLLKEYLPDYYWRMIIANPEASEGKYKPVVVIGIQTNPIEKPLNSLESAIKKGIKQLPGNKPGILAIYYTDPIEDFNSLCPSNLTMQEYISGLLTPFKHIGVVLMSSEPDYLGLKESKAGKTYLFYRKPWAFQEDFLRDDISFQE
jgi:hypothetical protein